MAWAAGWLPSEKQRALLWTGHAWRNPGAPPCGPVFTFAAFSASSVWAFGHQACAAVQRSLLAPGYVAFGAAGAGGCCRALGVLHWNGKAWRHLGIPYAMSTLSDLTQDGHGGIWLLVGAGQDNARYQRIYHDSHGHWTRRYIPQRPGELPTTLVTAWIPGTMSVWGVSAIGPASDPQSYYRAVIYKYGR